MLKENFHNQGRYDWEDEAYVEFKKIDTNLLLAKEGETGAIRKAWNIIKYKILKILYRIGKNGTDPISVFLSMISLLNKMFLLIQILLVYYLIKLKGDVK